MDRLTPAEAREAARRAAQHRHNLTMIQLGRGEYKKWRTLDNSEPKTLSMSHLKTRHAKHMQEQAFRQREIQRENMLLMERMSHILRSESTVAKSQAKAGPCSMRAKIREMNADAIRQENALLQRRLVKAQPVYSAAAWAKEYKTNEGYVRNLSYFERKKRRTSTSPGPASGPSSALSARSRSPVAMKLPRQGVLQAAIAESAGHGIHVQSSRSSPSGERSKSPSARANSARGRSPERCRGPHVHTSPRRPCKGRPRGRASLRTKRIGRSTSLRARSTGRGRAAERQERSALLEAADIELACIDDGVHAQLGVVQQSSPVPTPRSTALAENGSSPAPPSTDHVAGKIQAAMQEHDEWTSADRSKPCGKKQRLLPEHIVLRAAVLLRPGKRALARVAWIGSRKEIEVSLFDAASGETRALVATPRQIKLVAKHYARTRKRGSMLRVVQLVVETLSEDEFGSVVLKLPSRAADKPPKAAGEEEAPSRILKLKRLERTPCVSRRMSEVVALKPHCNHALLADLASALQATGVDLSAMHFTEAQVLWRHERRTLRLLAEPIDRAERGPAGSAATWYDFDVGFTSAHDESQQAREVSTLLQSVKVVSVS